MNFKQFLEEGRDAPLYHGTNMMYARKIIKTNSLIGREGYEPGDDDFGISFARIARTSLRFVLEYLSDTEKDVVIFEVDQRKLSQRYKITPISYFRGAARKMGEENRRNEFEERVETNKISNLDKYLTKIIVRSRDQHLLGPLLREHPLLWNFEEKRFVNQ